MSPGTPYQLHYVSDRVPGRTVDRTIVIPLSVGASVAARSEAHRSGYFDRRAQDREIVLADQRADLHLCLGRQRCQWAYDVLGAQFATVRIKYVYQAIYRTPAQNDRAFAQFGGAITGVRARQEVEIQQEFKVTLYNLDARLINLGGWSLSAHHVYDSNRDVLYQGNGDQRSLEAVGSVINTVAGTGVANFQGEGITATLAGLTGPYAVDFAPDGSWYMVDWFASTGFGRSPLRASLHA